jgi:hypothetical protein
VTKNTCGGTFSTRRRNLKEKRKRAGEVAYSALKTSLSGLKRLGGQEVIEKLMYKDLHTQFGQSSNIKEDGDTPFWFVS